MKKPHAPIYFVIGTRAQFIKIAPLMKLFEDNHLEYVFVYTSQHKETIDQIRELFKIKKPDVVLYSRDEAKTMFKFFGWMGRMVFYLFTSKKIFPKKGIVLTHGDTFTALWGAVCGKLAGCRVGHIESGLRSFNIFHPFPEELIRLSTFRFSDIYFCPNEWALQNLKKYKGIKINTKGNTLIDSVRMALNTPTHFVKPKEKYVVVSIHRYENIYSGKLENIIAPYIREVSKKFKVIFVLHPSTREVLEKNQEIKKIFLTPSIQLKPRYNYFDFVKLLKNCEFVITDGGSNQEELSYLGKPTILMRKATERIEGLNSNVVVSEYDDKILNNFINKYNLYKCPITKFVSSPSSIIYNYIIENGL